MWSVHLYFFCLRCLVRAGGEHYFLFIVSLIPYGISACCRESTLHISTQTHGNAEGELHGPLSFLSSLSSHTRSAAPERDAEACWHALRAGMKGAAAEAATADA